MMSAIRASSIRISATPAIAAPARRGSGSKCSWVKMPNCEDCAHPWSEHKLIEESGSVSVSGPCEHPVEEKDKGDPKCGCESYRHPGAFRMNRMPGDPFPVRRENPSRPD